MLAENKNCHKQHTALQKLQLAFCGLALSMGPTATSAENETVRGLIKPLNQAVISSEIAARVVSVPFRNGQSFNNGDTLIQFDCSLYRAQLDAAIAARDARTKEYESAAELLSYKATSPIEVEIARSEKKQTEARVEIETIRVEGCTIKAPYSGRVIEVRTNEHESVTAGTELVSVLSDEQLEIDLIVPSMWLGWLNKGEPFTFHVDETTKTYTARVTRIGAMVDPVSQTIQVVGTFDDHHDDVLSGMSGSATFDKNQ